MKRQPGSVSEAQAAARFDIIRELCGFVENGTATTVRIHQDDATGTWFVRIGSTISGGYRHEAFGRTLEDAVDAAHHLVR